MPANAALVVAGAISIPELRKVAESALGAWPRGTRDSARLADPAARRAAAGSRRSARLASDAAQGGHTRGAANEPGLYTAAGHEPDSRRNVRQPHQHEPARGAWLHVRSQLAVLFLAQRRTVRGGTGVRTDVTAPAVHEIFAELKRIFETRVTADELKLAKDTITQSLPASSRPLTGRWRTVVAVHLGCRSITTRTCPN